MVGTYPQPVRVPSQWHLAVLKKSRTGGAGGLLYDVRAVICTNALTMTIIVET